jgi:hypothetical protein
MVPRRRFHGRFIRRVGSHGMSENPARTLRSIVLGVTLALVAAQPAFAQSVLRDSETEALFRDISKPLIASTSSW